MQSQYDGLPPRSRAKAAADAAVAPPSSHHRESGWRQLLLSAARAFSGRGRGWGGLRNPPATEVAAEAARRKMREGEAMEAGDDFLDSTGHGEGDGGRVRYPELTGIFVYLYMELSAKNMWTIFLLVLRVRPII